METLVARCLIHDCQQVFVGESRTAIEREVEKHRRDEHDWVKPGRLHRFDGETSGN